MATYWLYCWPPGDDLQMISKSLERATHAVSGWSGQRSLSAGPTLWWLWSGMQSGGIFQHLPECLECSLVDKGSVGLHQRPFTCSVWEPVVQMLLTSRRTMVTLGQCFLPSEAKQVHSYPNTTVISVCVHSPVVMDNRDDCVRKQKSRFPDRLKTLKIQVLFS